MHPALWKLYRLRVRAALRRMWRGCKTVRGALMGLFTLFVLFAMFGQPLLLHATQGANMPVGLLGGNIREFIAVGMLIYCLVALFSSAGERAIYFSPSEIDFLFPGPFSRRQLLAYKVIGHVTTALFIGLALACSQMMILASWTAAFVGGTLALLLVTAVGMCAQLLAESVSERLYTRGRRALLAAVVFVAALVLGLAARQGLQSSWEQVLPQLRQSPLVVAVLAPFDVYARIITAERLLPDMLGWIALGVLLIVALYALAFWLDANYLETAIRVSQKIQERKRRVMSGEVLARSASGPVRSAQLPHLPWWGGAGPLVWRHLVQTGRGGRRAVFYIVLLCVAIGAPLVMSIHPDRDVLTVVPHVVVGFAAYITLLISFQFPLGFRSDYERMELLKALPCHSLAVAAGEMVVLVLVLSALQAAVFALTAVVIPSGAGELALAGLFALPYNWMLVAADNVLFLLYPTSSQMNPSEGMLNVGRAFLSLFTKVLLLGVCALVAGIPSAIVYFLTHSLLATAAVAWPILLAPAAAMLGLVAWAFRRYDVSAAVSE